MTRARIWALVSAAVLGLGACAPTDEGGPGDELPVLTLDEPTLEIGVLEGDDDLVFAAIESVVRLPDGRIAVADAGATRISLFDPDGAFLHGWGRQGEGPGEFRSLSRIYPLGPDSLMAAERHSGRLTVFDLDGEMGRLVPGAEISGDSAFMLDSWLSGRFWIEGALTREERARTRSALAGLRVPPDAPGYRLVHAAEDGALWIREPRTGGSTHTWTRVGPDGPDAVITTPTAFRPTWIRADEVLGVWSDESGVHFARAYQPTSTGETAAAPDWITTPRDGSRAGEDRPPTEEERVTEEELMEEIRSAIRSLASAQEIHYSSAMSYTAVIDSLERFEQPEKLVVDILRGDARAWIAVLTHPDLDRICGLAYGFGTPPGWTPGAILCGPEL